MTTPNFLEAFGHSQSAALGVALVVFAVWVVHKQITKRKAKSEATLAGTVSKQAESNKKPVDMTIHPLHDFDWKAKSPTKYRPFKPIYNITMAIQSDTPSELITVDQDYLDRINLRKELISKHGSKVRGHVAEGKDSVQELYTYLVQNYLPTRYPTIFRRSGDKGLIINIVTGDSHPTACPEDIDAALQILGTTVEEDLFILKPTPQGHRCVAFMCCFPSGWDPASKLGKHMNQIHTNVPGYEKIGASMERFFTRLEVGKSVKRNNWTVQTHRELFNATGNHVTSEDAVEEDSMDADSTFVRVELQTLSRLPKSHAILFSFKTYLYPIQGIKEEGIGLEVADAIEGFQKGNAPGMWRYKSAIKWGNSVCAYLRS